MSTAFLFFFVAFNALQNVATSIHGASNIGALSMGVLYAVIVVSAPLAPFPIRFWRARAAILVAQTGFWAFIGSNAFTIEWLLLLASCYLGVCWSVVWVAQPIEDCHVDDATLNLKRPAAALAPCPSISSSRALSIFTVDWEEMEEVVEEEGGEEDEEEEGEEESDEEEGERGGRGGKKVKHHMRAILSDVVEEGGEGEGEQMRENGQCEEGSAVVGVAGITDDSSPGMISAHTGNPPQPHCTSQQTRSLRSVSSFANHSSFISSSRRATIPSQTPRLGPNLASAPPRLSRSSSSLTINSRSGRTIASFHVPSLSRSMSRSSAPSHSRQRSLSASAVSGRRSLSSADFTRYVVQPLLGAQWMGGAMMIFGVAIAVCCFFAARFAKGLSSIRLMLLLGAASQAAVLVLTWLFQDRAMSKPAAFALVCSCALLWGIGATAFQSQITALLPLVFPSDVDAAYAHWISWSSAACSAYFLSSPYIATPIKNSLLLVFCLLSVIFAAIAVRIS
ncbi:unnamed protein product [Closterium sp. NIES-65]|nr:unnamed protein product [Closterium sp. NIES-65]